MESTHILEHYFVPCFMFGARDLAIKALLIENNF